MIPVIHMTTGRVTLHFDEGYRAGTNKTTYCGAPKLLVKDVIRGEGRAVLSSTAHSVAEAQWELLLYLGVDPCPVCLLHLHSKGV